MKIIRFQLKRLIVVAVVLIVICALHLIWRNEEESDCSMSDETQRKIENLLGEVKNTLNDLKLTYFLCYNSLWGALKFKKPLPWHNELEVCVLNKELAAIDEGFLNQIFKSNNLALAYNSAGGFYKVMRLGEMLPSATLTVFEEDPLTRQMRRIGWIHRVLPPNSCDELNCFPPELIADPMPTVIFGKHNIPAPRDGIEIQKYLFPNSWWKEITPINCQKPS